jgi:dimethylglycine dehydrogenase
MSLRLEKSFPGWGLELASDYYPSESGLGRFVKMEKGHFNGRDALLEQNANGPREVIVTFVVDVDGTDAYGGEPVYHQGELVGYTTSGGYGYRVEKSLAMAYVSPEFNRPGESFEIEILGERRSALLLDRPVYDPDGLLMKA